MVSDDQGWGDLAINGNTDVRTPHIDSLARDGARFERFFVQPVCSPTRAELLTGRWHPRGGVSGVSTGAERLDLSERTIADVLSSAGYATGCFGKWHNGSQYPYHPRGRGFAEFHGFTSGHWGDYFDAPLDHDGRDVVGAGYLADHLTGRAIDFIGRQAAAHRPFFCLLAFNTPHSPMQVPDEYWNRFADRDLKQPPSPAEAKPGKAGKSATGKAGTPAAALAHTRAALAMVENQDDNVGRVLAALRARGLDGDTVVIWLCDNGPNGNRWNGGMKGIKGSTDEGGVRSALHVRWPARIAPGTVVEPIAGAVDLMPTMLSMTGTKPADGKPLDGIDLSPWMVREADGKVAPRPAPERILFQHWAGRVSARTQRWRLDAGGRLFDMVADPSQSRDVSADHGAVHRRLTEAVAAWKADVFAGRTGPDRRPFPVGHAAMPRTVLPARDGVPHGGVRRSASAPNCSYFTGWTAAGDSMTWDVEIATAGRYEAVVSYTCPEGRTGSTLQLVLGTARWSADITEAHDPPARGPERDRAPRVGESPMKDFRRMSLGVVELSAGAGRLALSASKVAGGTVADVRDVELILLPDAEAAPAAPRPR